MRIRLHLLVLVLTSATYGYADKYEYSAYSFSVTEENSRLTGAYTCYYPNGEIRSKGKLLNGYRVGVWTVYDSSGQQLVAKDYSQIKNYPFNSSSSVNQPEPNEFVITSEAKQFTVSKRLWRNIDFVNNPVLAKVNWTEVWNKLNASNAAFYSAIDDEFKHQMDKSALHAIISKSISGLYIKEDYYYNAIKGYSEFQIVGIAPYVKSESTTTTLFWLYYPAIQQEFTKLVLPTASKKTLAQTFYLRDFAASVIKESSLTNKFISDYCKGDEIKQEAMRIELFLLETEHDIWLSEKN